MGFVSALGAAVPGVGPILAGVGAVASLASGVMGAVSASKTAAAEQANANYQSQVAANNAQLATRQAQVTSAAGAQQASNSSMQGRAIEGQIVANQAASGVDVTTGSNAQVQQSQGMLTQLNANTIRSNAANQSYSYMTQATSDTAQSGLYSQQANQAAASAPFGIASSLLSGASGVTKQFQQWQSVGGAPSAVAATGGWTGGNQVMF